jgi:hypothetical protein
MLEDAATSDPFRNPKDVEKAIHLAGISLSRAERATPRGRVRGDPGRRHNDAEKRGGGANSNGAIPSRSGAFAADSGRGDLKRQMSVAFWDVVNPDGVDQKRTWND